MHHTITLNTGARMPLIGFGTYLINDHEVCERSVAQALEAGYRLIDTAQFYGNEAAVGRAIKNSGIPRGELFITTKLWHTDTGDAKTRPAFEASLKRLGLDYVDLYLIHHPYGDIYGSWRVMEKLFHEGLAKAIGLSNFYPDRLQDLILHHDVPPAVNQLETHIYHQRQDARALMAEHNIALMAWGPFSQGKTDLLENATLKEIAAKHGKSTAQAALRFLLQQNIAVIPKSTHLNRIKENIDIFDFTLTDEEMTALTALDTKKSAGLPHDDPANVKRIVGFVNPLS
ncbi:MAG: aldo/keto reductase [Christensenellales bacterium]|jgi:2,5-diketo-D-gluconate reductase A